MKLSDSLIRVQESLIEYLSNEYRDYKGEKKQGLNKLNDSLKDFDIKFNDFSIGALDNFSNNFVYLMINSVDGVEPNNIGSANTFLNSVKLSVLARQTVNRSSSTIMFNIINLIIQDCIREWFFTFDKEVYNIIDVSFRSEEPEFYFNDTMNVVNNFSSVNAIRYINTIDINIITDKGVLE